MSTSVINMYVSLLKQKIVVIMIISLQSTSK